MLTILHTGQTGVERGADRTARALGYPVRGYCQFNSRDEFGALPPQLKADLTASQHRGPRTVWALTLDIADVIIIVVPKRSTASEQTGIAVLQTMARSKGVQQYVVDPLTHLDEIVRRIAALPLGADLKIMVCGPRETRWPQGEHIGSAVVTALSALALPDRRRVLVVDDHVDTAQMICELVTMLGHDCVPAMSGREAITRAASFKPNVGLFDIRLPDLTGYELARQVRATQTTPLFLAAVTGWDEARDAERAYAAGFDHHVMKPMGLELVRGLLERARQSLAAA